MAISDAIEKHEEGIRNQAIGGSLQSSIYVALRAKGYIVDDVRNGLLKRVDGKVDVVENGKVTSQQG